MAIGENVDIAINHDPAAIAMHKANHPHTKHYCESVWDVDPVEAVAGRNVGLAWFSPDCKHFSKAKGGKPKDKAIRALAWVIVKWGIAVRPEVMMMENVEEFKTWGPLDDEGNPIESRKGETFKAFIACLTTGLKDPNHPAWEEIEQYLGIYFDKQRLINGLGYDWDFNELVACDYGAPTKRKRFFGIMRCDGRPIVWPEKTHGPKDSLEVKSGKLLPYVPAADIIDWNIPCKSIFGRKKPLAENTLKRIAKGIQKFVVNNPEPFILQVNHTGSDWHYTQELGEPLPTVTSKNGFAVATPYIARIGQTGFGGDNLSYSVEKPLTTVVSKQEHCLVTPYMLQTDNLKANGSLTSDINNPLNTIVARNSHAVVEPILAPTLIQTGYGERQGQSPRALDIEEPLGTIVSTGKHAIVETMLAPVNQEEILSPYIIQTDQTGCNGSGTYDIKNPLTTVVSTPKHAIVTPYLVQYHTETGKDQVRGQDMDEPLNTITGMTDYALAAPYLIQYHTETTANGVRGQEMTEPIQTVDGSNRYSLVSAFIAKNYAGESRSVASDINESLHTITARQVHNLVEVAVEDAKVAQPNQELEEFFEKYYGKPMFGDRVKDSELAATNESPNNLMASHIIQMNKNSIGTDIQEPLNTTVAEPGHIGEVRSFLIKYYGQGVGQSINEPLDTVVSKDRFGLIEIDGVNYQIVDIGMRMLEPHELFAAQGFPEDYIIDRDYKGDVYPKTAQVARCGNAVPPPFANALVRANLPEMCIDQELALQQRRVI